MIDSKLYLYFPGSLTLTCLKIKMTALFQSERIISKITSWKYINQQQNPPMLIELNKLSYQCQVTSWIYANILWKTFLR